MGYLPGCYSSQQNARLTINIAPDLPGAQRQQDACAGIQPCLQGNGNEVWWRCFVTLHLLGVRSS